MIRRRMSVELWKLLVTLCLFLPAGCQESAQMARRVERIPQPRVQGEVATGGASERRTALVIGNGTYSSAPLRNSPNDAKAMAKVLRGLGFDVMENVNVDQRGMKEAVRQFGQKIRGGGVGLFYYAGHGMQVNGKNYLIPIGAKIEIEQQVEDESIDVGRVLREMEGARNRVNIVILDACRDNPFARSFRSSAQGLASMDASRGTFIAYATAPGSVASDGAGDHGIYTDAIMKVMSNPGLKIEEVFKQVLAVVEDGTGGKQSPWVSSSLRGDFYFSPPAGSPTHTPPSGGDTGRVQVAGGHTVIEKPQPEVSRSGSMRVETNPGGATVYLDGVRKGTAPLSLYGLKPGTMQVKVVQDGYESRERSVEIQAGKETDMSFLLDRVTPPAPAPSPAPTYAPAPVPVAAPPAPSSGTVQAGAVWREPVTGMEFVWVPAGCFQMGCGSWTSDCGSDEKPVHEVCIGGHWMAKYEVTQGQWKRVMGNNPSYFKKGDDYPVEQVSWDDAKEFIRKLNGMAGASYQFRLPSEAEWEYAARSGGKAEKFSGGINVDAVAWYTSNSGTSTHAVGAKSANGLGIYDMSGNVWEWCEDIYAGDAYGKHQRNDPIYMSGGSNRVRRGGGWSSGPTSVRCAYRNCYDPANRGDNLGFRLVRTL